MPLAPPMLALALLAAPALADVSLFVGPPGGVGDVRVFAEGGGLLAAPPELQQIVLLPIDATGRTELEALRAAAPRLRGDTPGGRVALPAAAGSLYHYVRPGTPAVFGYFHVAPDGTAASVLERPGAGITGSVDPFLPRVATAADGSGVLVATTLDAGGDVLEIDLGTGLVHDRTAGSGPLALVNGGLLLLPDFGALVTTTGVLRFARVDGASAAPLGFPSPAPTYFDGGLVGSDDGSTAATIAGADATQAHVFAFRAAGDPVRVSQVAAPLSGAGFLPATNGPHLALSTDGSWAAWRTEGLSREVFARPVDVAATRVAQVTGDQTFVDTLDETGVILFFGRAALGLLVGEPGDKLDQIDSADVYRIDLGLAAAATAAGKRGADLAVESRITMDATNLTRTSGDLLPPFVAGDLSSEGLMLAVDGFEGLFFFDESGSSGPVSTLRFDGTGLSTLIADVRSVDSIDVAGGHLVLSIEREVGGNRRRQLATMPTSFASPPVLFDVGPDTTPVLGRVASPSGFFAALVELSGNRVLGRIHVPSSSVSGLSLGALVPTTALALTPLASVALGIGATPAQASFVTWNLAGAVQGLGAGTTPGHVLPPY